MATMPVGLSDMPDNALGLIFLHVPAKDLVKHCVQVLKQWHFVLSSDKGFWRDKMEADGYKLEWRQLAALSLLAYQSIAVKQPFGRNFIKDSWDLTKTSAECCQLDPRWECAKPRMWMPGKACDYELFYEAPPVFRHGQLEINAAEDDDDDVGAPILACLSTGADCWDRDFVEKRIVIRLADEGLIDEIMDNVRPTILISELVGDPQYHSFYRDVLYYRFYAWLSTTDHAPAHPNWETALQQEGGTQCHRQDFRDGNGQKIGALIQLRFYEGYWQSWNLVNHEFSDYAAGMRYIIVDCFADNLDDASGYGIKMAKCTVKAALREQTNKAP